MGLKLNRIKHQFKLEDLKSIVFFNNIPKLHLNFPNPNSDDKKEEATIQLESDASEETLDSNTQKKLFYEALYKDSWEDLKFKDLFNNDFELYTFWLDIISDEDFDKYMTMIVDDCLDKKFIEKNNEYIDIYTQYLKNEKSIDKMIRSDQKSEKTKVHKTIAVLDIFQVIDTTFGSMDDLTIVNPECVVLIAKRAEKLIEMKKKLMISGDFISREIIYNSKSYGHIFISIIEFN